MKIVHSPSLALIAFLAVLLQSVVFAVECPSPAVITLETDREAPTSRQCHQGMNGNHECFRLDGEEDCSLKPGQTLPVLDIHVGGEISVSENNIVKRSWTSKSLESKGRVQLVMYIAANRGAARQNKLFTDALIEKKFSLEKLDTTVIVHMADTVSFANGIVVNKLAKRKAKQQSMTFVIDDDGLGLQRWGMKHKSFAIIVLDANGRVLFAKDGPLTEIELEDTIRLIESQLT